MTDYSSWKVTDLKAELKRRGIPQTGLRVKQNFIDRLLQADSEAQPEAPAEAPAPSNIPEQHAPEVPEQLNQHVSASDQKLPSAPEPGPSSAELKEPLVAEVPESLSRGPIEDAVGKDKEESKYIDQVAAFTQDSAPAMDKIQEPKMYESTQSQEVAKEPVKIVTTPSVSSTPQESESTTVLPPEEKIDSREESIDDSRKRKRRSQSPPPSPKTAALKRARADNGLPRVVLKEDVLGETIVPSEESVAAPIPDAAAPDDTEMQGTGMEKIERGLHEPEPTPQPQPSTVQEAHREADQATELPSVPHGEPGAEKPEEPHVSKHTSGDARFKSLFPAANGGRELSLSPKGLAGEEDADRVVSPALHPATTSLYIRNFIRPLQPASLKKHLVTLATPPASSVDPDIILDFFLDSIKTHSFVTFTNVSAASRVRSSLHGTIWPDERTRKPLWVDFVPEDKVKEWIAVEQESGSGARGAAPRWEVMYDETDQGVTASLQEAGPTNQIPMRNNRDPNQNLGREPPLGPRATHGPMRRESQPAAPPAAPARYEGESFKALDDRFLSTAAKPKLYYQPVNPEISERRLDRFAGLHRAGSKPRRGGDEMRKYTFEDADFFVDRGPEYGSRGRRRGGRGARFRDRGEFRDSWRR
ncbi:hypothetical protein AJ78_01771 [Emergomyces pasteurianus Ep9510]|uniref:SAP domain-containing protein n=1 Tax=Emergomyces pasteurianus Ep9510 TaxID=1447872 RepID=A0A1J9QSH4_9EURO|nr:hypothetical protein AJ78_01771 [Emergomyces pasteurianus Ep9510]